MKYTVRGSRRISVTEKRMTEMVELILWGTEFFSLQPYPIRMPGVSWTKNMLGFRLSDKQMDDVPFPKLELTTHVTIKTVQAGGLLGSCFVAPISAAVRPDTRNWAEIQQRMAIYGKNGVIVGLILGPFLTMMKLRSIESDDAVQDRCYRLRKNRNQVRVDQGSILGALAGYGVVAHGSFGDFANSLLFGSVVGMSSGIVFATLLNSVISS